MGGEGEGDQGSGIRVGWKSRTHQDAAGRSINKQRLTTEAQGLASHPLPCGLQCSWHPCMVHVHSCADEGQLEGLHPCRWHTAPCCHLHSIVGVQNPVRQGKARLAHDLDSPTNGELGLLQAYVDVRRVNKEVSAWGACILIAAFMHGESPGCNSSHPILPPQPQRFTLEPISPLTTSPVCRPETGEGRMQVSVFFELASGSLQLWKDPCGASRCKARPLPHPHLLHLSQIPSPWALC